MRKFDFDINDVHNIEVQRRFASLVREKVTEKEAEAGHKLLVYIGTFGCQQNEADSERLMGTALQMGYGKTTDIESADLIVFNTCAVREHAELKALSKTGQLRHLKEKKPGLLIGIWGCMPAQEYRKEAIKRSYPYVDFAAGTNMLHRFPEILLDVMESKRRRYYVNDEAVPVVEGTVAERESDLKAWVSVMYGCNNFCTYCIVPHVRGREKSRSPEAILSEVRELVEHGYKEITLLGQNVNSYGKTLPEEEKMTFAQLLEKVCEIPGDFVVRFMTSHPKDASDELIEVMARQPKIARHFHLPLQSGNSEILRAMNRHYDREKYLETARRIREAMPDITLTTDIIVGFPGETEKQFLDTLSAVKEVGFDSVYAFIFSPRKGTPAYDMPDETTREEKNGRFDRLLKLEAAICAEDGKKLCGKVLRLLCDEHTDKDGNSSGRSGGNRVIRFAAGDKDYYGSFVNVKVTRADGSNLFGELIG